MKPTKEEFLSAGVVLVLVGIIVFFGLDCGLGRSEDYRGVVVNREYEPAHTTTSTSWDGKRFHTSTTHHPAQWTLIVNTPMLDCDIRVSVAQGDYERARIGDPAYVRGRRGRWTGMIGLWRLTGLGPAEAEGRR